MTIVDTPERRQLRELTRAFVTREVLPHLADWERAGVVPRSLHETAARVGLLGIGFPESVGGSGGDLLDSIVVTEEIIRSGGSSGLIAALFTHGIALPHIVAAQDEHLIDTYVRPTLGGTMIGALAITEPDGGSDVAAIRTCAVRDGDHYVVNGAKTYITSGVRADFVTTAVCTDFPGSGSLSLLVIDKGTPGFTVGRRLEKLGWHCSDTAELSFVDVRVPVANRVGPEDTAFLAVMQQFAAERLSLATSAYATAQRCVDLAVRWCRDRSTFGRPLASRQLVRHRLAEMHTRAEAARAYVHEVAERVARPLQLGASGAAPRAGAVGGQPVVTEVAMAKNVAVAACDHVVDAALQLHGGFGYLRDAEVERHYRDARILGIGGGTTEIMNEIIAKGMGL
ncbi:acyl-CoA dehydrogenase family protein [Micromonospora sp. RP3T]|uniref:acyl-CoA dehydrogenase family protein n=1 Tax=Micromonospora sp. RP3T TaxID=2135446 RepID=UPI000D17CC42|nr:acyl-CoA dehydrogenase family protein [Micromonospora sp. RP3T]PTA44148.1 acyl-CoA dehydrogenase [Micromonospora sp. RP3T]